jgi:hypothetical protein
MLNRPLSMLKGVGPRFMEVATVVHGLYGDRYW